MWTYLCLTSTEQLTELCPNHGNIIRFEACELHRDFHNPSLLFWHVYSYVMRAINYPNKTQVFVF
jgi:hypothetical protein